MKIGAALILTVILAAAVFPPASNVPAQSIDINNGWESRLEALDPSDPAGYFLLAEEVADAAADDQEVRLARRLFALAAVIAPDRFGRSACIALAAMADDEQQRRRLVALGSLLTSRRDAGMPDEGEDVDLLTDRSAILTLCEVLSSYRRGAGRRAASRLQRGDAADLFRAVQDALPGETSRLLNLSSSSIRVRLSEAGITRTLQVESALLAGADRTWSSDLVLTRGNPLIEIDPERLDEALGVDAAHLRYRDGRWVE